MTPELFSQIATAIGGPGAVIFLWWYMSRASEPKGDPAQSAAEDIRAIKDILHRLEMDMQILMDRTQR